MRVRLISITQPLTETIDPTGDALGEKQMAAEDLITYCARVSSPQNQLNLNTAPKLIKYLIDHHHWSPFEMASMSVEITTSRAIAQQILRHRSFSFQEFSQRYAQVTALEPIQLRKQGQKNRQGGSDSLGNEESDMWIKLCDQVTSMSRDLYNRMIDAGIAKECARMVLPLTTETTLYMSGNIRSWIHYLQIRCDEHTQKEHRDIAVNIRSIFKLRFPAISEALGW